MIYLGGKSKIAREIVDVMISKADGRAKFVDLFCGGCSVAIAACSHFSNVVCNDSNKYLIALWSALQSGWIPPEKITYSDYCAVKRSIDGFPPYYVGYVGFCGSFKGLFFGSYAWGQYDDKLRRRDYIAERRRGLLYDTEKLCNAEFICFDYKDITIPSESIIYCDPPYNNARPYKGTDYDTTEFLSFCYKLADNGNLVFVSEYNISDNNFVCVWEKKQKTTLCHGSKNSIERLFIYKG